MNDFVYYMIYLPHQKERWGPTIKHLNSFGINPVLFAGMDGIAWKLKTGLTNVDKWNKQFTSGRLGCSISHFMLWNHLHHTGGWDKAMIFEDDVRLIPSFKKDFKKAYSQLPKDWEMAMVGNWWHTFTPDERYSENILIGGPYCTHAYMIRKNITQLLVDSCSVLENYVDLHISVTLRPKIKHFVFDPTLAEQESFIDSEFYTSLTKHRGEPI